MKLINKHILLFVPDFFGYYESIKEEIMKRGAKVTTILENYSNSSWAYRMIYVKVQNLRYRYAHNRMLKEIDNVGDKVDYILVIRGEAISKDIIEYLKIKWPKAPLIMYQWDSVHNNPNALEISQYFNKIYTFDNVDAKKYGWKYRPLFYIHQGETRYADRKYDLSLVGTLYYKRAVIHNRIKQIASEKGFNYFGYLYSLKYVYVIHKYFMRDVRYKDADNRDIFFKPLSREEMSAIYDQSKVVVDYAAVDQSGLTMRTIESIGHRCKLITNNKRILEEPIFNKKNILVYDGEEIEVPDSFIAIPYQDPDKNLTKYYSLAGWVDTIFE